MRRQHLLNFYDNDYGVYMRKYLVDIYLPASGKHYDAYLPAEKRIGEVTLLLIDIVNSMTGGSYKETADARLLYADNGKPLNLNDTVYDAGIRNSTKLILI